MLFALVYLFGILLIAEVYKVSIYDIDGLV